MSILVEFNTPPGKPVLRGIAHYWEVIRTLDVAGEWTAHDVFLQSNARERATVADYVNRLAAGGMAEQVGERDTGGTKPAPTYRLKTRPARVPRLTRSGHPVKQGLGQTHMWNLIRGRMGRDGFTFRDLVAFGATDDVEISVETAKAYVKRLGEAGYLMCIDKGTPGKPTVWRLRQNMNTGPLPPLILRTKVVYDQNRKAAIGPLQAEEDRP